MEEVKAFLGCGVSGATSRHVHRHTQVYAESPADIVKKSAVLVLGPQRVYGNIQFKDVLNLLNFNRLNNNLSRVFIPFLAFLLWIDKIKLS